jgi:hypothetical protein
MLPTLDPLRCFVVTRWVKNNSLFTTGHEFSQQIDSIWNYRSKTTAKFVFQFPVYFKGIKND